MLFLLFLPCCNQSSVLETLFLSFAIVIVSLANKRTRPRSDSVCWLTSTSTYLFFTTFITQQPSDHRRGNRNRHNTTKPLIMTTSTLINAALLALSIQTASCFIPSSPSSIKSTTNLFQSTTTDFSLDEYLASKIGPIEEALKASVESRIPQTDKVCLLFVRENSGRYRIAIELCFFLCIWYASSSITLILTTYCAINFFICQLFLSNQTK